LALTESISIYNLNINGFLPKRTHVQAYRLVGYEMRKLRNEDFANDTIDAGELGSICPNEISGRVLQGWEW